MVSIKKQQNLSLATISQKVKVSFSSALDILYGVPQWSILGPLPFNIDTFNMIWFFLFRIDDR